jgi:excisionase family DNA binding protein
VPEQECGTWTPYLYSLALAAAMLNIGRSTLHRLIKDGDLPTVRIGRRRLVAPRDLEVFMARLAAQEEASEWGTTCVTEASSRKEVADVVG